MSDFGSFIKGEAMSDITQRVVDCRQDDTIQLGGMVTLKCY